MSLTSPIKLPSPEWNVFSSQDSIYADILLSALSVYATQMYNFLLLKLFILLIHYSSTYLLWTWSSRFSGSLCLLIYFSWNLSAASFRVSTAFYQSFVPHVIKNVFGFILTFCASFFILLLLPSVFLPSVILSDLICKGLVSFCTLFLSLFLYLFSQLYFPL